MAPSKRKKRIVNVEDEDTQDVVEEPVEYQKPNFVQKNPNYILILLLMAVSFFSGYLLNKTTTLQKSLVDAKTQQAQPGTAAGAQAPTSVPIDKVKALFTKDNIHFGDANKKVLIVEITDPSCPFCHIAGGLNPELSKQANFQYVSDGGQYTPPVPEIRKLVEEGKASLVVEYGTGHGNGRLGMEALYCAYEKGDFWPVHDRLMSNEGYELLNNTVQKAGAKWSQSNKCFYVPCTREAYNKLETAIKDKAEINSAPLKEYLQKNEK